MLGAGEDKGSTVITLVKDNGAAVSAVRLMVSFLFLLG